ncbi:hypothetical protein WMF28_05505 [Sorangium sp. So ce590]|uniref:hypothetical protein n=1 Tax=Sorangium sp. So ce590 TaxID=3133317 RepID=UPI003F5EF984
MAKKCVVRHPWYLALSLAALPATAHAEIREDEPTMEIMVAGETMDAVSSSSTTASLERDSDAWKVTKCAAAITVVVVSVAVPAAKVVKLRKFVIAVGGVREAARLLVGATTFAEKARVIGGAIGAGAAEVLSIDAIITNC